MQINKLSVCILGVLAYGYSNAELVEIKDTGLEELSGEAGITIDIDASGLSFSYSYKNNENTAEKHWIVGGGTVGEVVQVNGITLDIADAGAIAIGIPTEVILKNVNTGDYFIADSGDDINSPPRANEVGEAVTAQNDNADRKLFGLKWNTPVIATLTSPGAASVLSHDFSPHKFHGSGQVLIVAD